MIQIDELQYRYSDSAVWALRETSFSVGNGELIVLTGKSGCGKSTLFRCIEVFREKDFRSAKMQEIAERAGIPVGLIYSYYKNKEELFNKIAASLLVNLDKVAMEEEQADGLPSEKYKNIAEDYISSVIHSYSRKYFPKWQP